MVEDYAMLWIYHYQVALLILCLCIYAVPYGACDVNASYCFGRLPGALEEADAELLAFDSGGNVYRLAKII